MVNGVMAVTRIDTKNGHVANNTHTSSDSTTDNTNDSNTHTNSNNNTHTNSNNNKHTNSDDSDNNSESTVVFSVPSFNEFITDFNIIRKCVYSGPVTSYRLVHIRVFS